MTESKTLSSNLIPEFNIGEIVKARDRLWRIDKIHKVEKEIEEVKKKFVYYSVSNITGQPSSQVLIPDIEIIKKSVVPKLSSEIIGLESELLLGGNPWVTIILLLLPLITVKDQELKKKFIRFENNLNIGIKMEHNEDISEEIQRIGLKVYGKIIKIEFADGFIDNKKRKINPSDLKQFHQEIRIL